MSLHDEVSAQLLRLLDGASDQRAALNDATRLLGKWRSVLIANTLLKHHGTVVMQGPLEGLDFLPASSEGCHVAKILGCYEQPLQPFIEAAIAQKYETILNIGCAEGYYAVGMARNMPQTVVHAFDLDGAARVKCEELAAKNTVQDRVVVGGEFLQSDFARYANQSVLLMCDIEGAELQLLRPNESPVLREMDIIVESHECLSDGITKKLIQRFESSHHITVVGDDGQRTLDKAPEWFVNLAHLDQLLATWEWRSGATPWLVMTVKKRSVPLSQRPMS